MTAEGMPEAKALQVGAAALPGPRDELRSEWTRWLTEVFSRSNDPLWFVTLTLKPLPWETEWQTTPTRSRVLRAARKFGERLTASLAAPSFFVVREEGALNGREHLHALATSTTFASIRSAVVEHTWREGFAQMRPVDSVGGVSGYVTKYVVKNGDPDWIAGGPLFRG